MARMMKDSGIEWIGEIPEEWAVSKVKYFVDCYDGRRVPVDAGERVSGPYPYWGAGSITDYVDSYLFDEELILLGEDGAPFFDPTRPVAFLVNEKIWVNNHIHVLKPHSDVYSAYLLHFLNTVDYKTYINGSILNKLTQGNMNSIAFIVPTYDEQQRIADFLDRKCAEIDAVIEKTKATIEEYKKLKQSVITEAVTKGIRGNRAMKDSGIEWAKEIPVEWDSINPKALFTQRKDKARAGQRQLTASQQHGVIYQDEYMELTGSKVVTVEKDFDILKQVEAGDFVISMRSFQGGLEYSHLTGSISSAYVMLVPNLQLVYPRFFRWLLKSPVYINALQSTSNMVRDGQAMRYSNFAQVRLYTVPLDEQEEIADYLDEKCEAMDALIAKKTALLTEMETYKKSLIYEYVTGKTECIDVQEQASIVYPSFPAAINTDKPRFAQAVLMSKILNSNVKQMGRVKLEKMLYTIENSIGFDFDTEYVREAAGPLHSSIYECEGIISHKNKWFTMKQSQYGVSYTPTSSKDKYQKYYDKYFGDYDAEINRIISVFRDYTMDQAEIVATLFAAWNDAIIDQKQFTDEDIVDDVLNNWHENKKRFAKDVWLRAMAQMKQNNIVPKGYGKRTVRRKECNA